MSLAHSRSSPSPLGGLLCAYMQMNNSVQSTGNLNDNQFSYNSAGTRITEPRSTEDDGTGSDSDGDSFKHTDPTGLKARPSCFSLTLLRHSDARLFTSISTLQCHLHA